MSFQNEPGLFPHQVDLPSDRVLLVQMAENDYREASFLDARLLNEQRPMEWADWQVVENLVTEAPSDARWIFHIGHVGSTLIARLLGESPQALSLREPQLLRQLAELHKMDGSAHSPWRPGLTHQRLETTIQWLSRSFRPDQKAVVKASSFTSDMATDILSCGDRAAVLLGLSPERYIQTILAGENSRKELSVLAGPRLERLNARLGADVARLWELSEAQKAAMSWACEMTALEAASSNSAGSSTLWVDFDDFLSNPSERLIEIARHLQIDMDEKAALALAQGPIMTQYSKAPEHAYSSSLRESVLAQAAGDFRTEISAAMQWLDTLATQFPQVAASLGRMVKD